MLLAIHVMAGRSNSSRSYVFFCLLPLLMVLQFFFLIILSCCSFILDVYLLGGVDAFTPIPPIFSFVPHLLFVSSTFPWT